MTTSFTSEYLTKSEYLTQFPLQNSAVPPEAAVSKIFPMKKTLLTLLTVVNPYKLA